MVGPGGFISYDTKSDKIVQAAITRALGAVSNLKPAFKTMAVSFFKTRKEIFRLKSAGRYPDFKGLKIKEIWSKSKFPRPEKRTRDGAMTAYQNYKVKKAKGVNDRGYPLLQFSGKLSGAITKEGGPGQVLVISKTSFEIGVSEDDIPYANYHQSDAPRSKIPLRKFLFIGKGYGDTDKSGDLPRFLNILNDYVLRSMDLSAKQARGGNDGKA